MSEQQPWEYHPEESARAYEKPTLTVVGVFRTGKLVRVEWSDDGHTVSLSNKTLEACEMLGVIVVDKVENYIFSGEMI